VVTLNQHIAWLASAVMRGLGADAAATGAVVRAPGFAVEIKNNCNAIFELGLYAAAVWAYPASLGAKMAGTLIGAGVLNLVNLFRVVTCWRSGSLPAIGSTWPISMSGKPPSSPSSLSAGSAGSSG
jgi:exosortase/archaeosortase